MVSSNVPNPFGVYEQFEKHAIALYAKTLEYQMRMASAFARAQLTRAIRNLTVRDDWKAIPADIKAFEDLARQDRDAIDSNRLASLIAEKGDHVRREVLSAWGCNFEAKKNANPPAFKGMSRLNFAVCQFHLLTL